MKKKVIASLHEKWQQKVEIYKCSNVQIVAQWFIFIFNDKLNEILNGESHNKLKQG
jgi:hypothetical protein